MLGAHRWQLDWLVADPSYDDSTRDANGVKWIFTSVEGFWGAPGPDAELTRKLNQHGVFRTPGYKRERTITITGRAYCLDRKQLERAEAKVSALLDDPDKPYQLKAYTELGVIVSDVHLDDEITSEPLEIVSEPGIEFSVQMISPDPRKYTDDWVRLTAMLPSSGGGGLDFVGLGDGLDFNTTGGLDFGVSTQTGFVDLKNTGTAPAPVVLTLFGPLDTPVVTVPGGTLTYNSTLSEGEFLVIDPSAPSVRLGGTANRRRDLNPADFNAFEVPGNGTLRVGLSHAGSPAATGYLRAEFRPAWW